MTIFEETLWHTERTIYNTLAVAKLLMSRRVRAVNYKVVLTGEGSDELFGGYPAFRRDMFLHGLDHLPPSERRSGKVCSRPSNEQFRGAMLAEERGRRCGTQDARRIHTIVPATVAGGWPDACRPVAAGSARGR